MGLSNSVEFVFFAKAPRLGHVKTRLFPGDSHQCLSFYEAFIKDFAFRYTRNCNLPLRPLIDFESDEEIGRLISLLDSSIEFLRPIKQEKTSFFKRLALGINKIEASHFFLTGADLPHFPFEYIKDISFNKDTVFIGPDTDGGFYFLAGPKECAQVFSSSIDQKDVFNSLVRNFKGVGFRVKVLKHWSDIDTASDLVICLNQFYADELPHTYDVVESFDLRATLGLKERNTIV